MTRKVLDWVVGIITGVTGLVALAGVVLSLSTSDPKNAHVFGQLSMIPGTVATIDVVIWWFISRRR